MATLILLRHGRTSANAQGVLAGRTPGVVLDELGREQAARAGARLADVPLAALVSSPLERCRETAHAVLEARQEATAAAAEPAHPLDVTIDAALTECDYGSWQGRPLAELAKEPLWRTVQQRPSAVTFPGGETMAGMQERAVAAVRAHDAAVQAAHGPGAVWAAVSHGDVIKSILADALGLELDRFQRIAVGPASISIVRYAAAGSEVLAMNTEAGGLDWLAQAPAGAAVGGGAGHA